MWKIVENYGYFRIYYKHENRKKVLKKASEIMHDFIECEIKRKQTRPDAFQDGFGFCESVIKDIDKDSYWPYKSGLFIREDLWRLLEDESVRRYPDDIREQCWFKIGVHTKLIRHLHETTA